MTPTLRRLLQQKRFREKQRAKNSNSTSAAHSIPSPAPTVVNPPALVAPELPESTPPIFTKPQDDCSTSISPSPSSTNLQAANPLGRSRSSSVPLPHLQDPTQKTSGVRKPEVLAAKLAVQVWCVSVAADYKSNSRSELYQDMISLTDGTIFDPLVQHVDHSDIPKPPRRTDTTMTEAATPAGPKQQFTFQTEIKQLLNLLSHSLYQNREIALRELLSNASDALNKLRYIQLSESQYRDDAALEIRLEPDADGKVLAICDNGIGLTRDELVENLGTIAHSGSLDFLSKMQGDAKKDLSLIGQFGVGFYSAFMLADRVEVVTRSYKDSTGWRWESEGTGSYSIEEAGDVPRGAQIRLHLKEDAQEFLKEGFLKEVVRKYSTFVPVPIMLGTEQVNSQRPIWVEPKSQLTSEQYHAFYEWLTRHTSETPLWYEHLSSDSPLQFSAILYCPPMNYERLGFGRIEHGLSLCAKRVLVQEDNKDLLPEYLHFMYGLVDSADLPLNVSRETLQDSTIIPRLRKVLTTKVLNRLGKLAEEQPADYEKFYNEFGPILRSGVASDYENREKIAGLMRFVSSFDGAERKPLSLENYVSRMREDQTQIYYLGGPDIATLERNPHLETFRKRNLEVLFLTDPVDEFALAQLTKFKDKELVSIDSADVKLPASTDALEEASQPEAADKPSDVAPSGFERLLEVFRQVLGERVTEVRRATRLSGSPCCLVNPQGSMSSQLQKVLSQNVKDYSLTKRIFEVNASSPFIKRLCVLVGNSDNDGFVMQCGEQLFANAMLADGLLPDPHTTVDRMQQFMEELAATKSSIIV